MYVRCQAQDMPNFRRNFKAMYTRHITKYVASPAFPRLPTPNPGVKSRLRVSSSKRQVYRQDVQVFPTEDLIESSAKSYTIAAGRHVYDFSIKFPGANDQVLPPTFSQGTFQDNAYFYCEHSIKATVKKLKSLTSDPRMEKPLTVVPYFDQGALERSAMKTISSIFDLNKDIRIDMHVLVPECGLPQSPYPVPLQLAVKSHVPVTIQNVSVSLNRVTQWNSRDIKRHRHVLEDKKSIVLEVVPLNQSGTILDLSDSIQHLKMCGYTSPSFNHELLSVSYELLIGITISLEGSSHGAKSAQLLELKGRSRCFPQPYHLQSTLTLQRTPQRMLHHLRLIPKLKSSILAILNPAKLSDRIFLHIRSNYSRRCII
ncbi:hypothetical protein B9G98_04382 [Wickerhamiella sorbophila]|uniref:Arrestin-like N-terminal domain-containing protein n=1 Tax=Wickerhamiella sorbophila TaxID=45607 RepID=A0A2T0FP45_9ASCO|nr:hypothetical protein B9G98_04382 [Wickerhamiella sorbophila]PRT56762.1 hypothetical protein B9G98_04382 [Wickerhamiella sorbophila]